MTNRQQARCACSFPPQPPPSASYLFRILGLHARRNFGRVVGSCHLLLQPFKRSAYEASLKPHHNRNKNKTASQQKQKQNRITTETKTKLINRNEVKYQTLCTQPHLLLQSLQLSVHVDQAYRAQVNNPQQRLEVGS